MPDTIYYTWTDEAPMLATCSLLPVVQRFVGAAGVKLELKDISLAGRILAHFPDHLSGEQRVPDALAELGELAKTPEANIIKLPNISASIPQLKAAIAELQQQGFAVPDYPDEPKTDEEKAVKATYAKVLGSAVNPVLREGNSDRRVAAPVKDYARLNPHSMGEWTADSKTHVAHMTEGDFYGSEQSFVKEKAGTVRIELETADGVQVLKDAVPLEDGEVFDGSVMQVRALREFLRDQIKKAKQEGVLLSLHLKATMMKVSDPILFGHAVSVYYDDLLERNAEVLHAIGFNPDNGIGDLMARMPEVSEEVQQRLQADLQAVVEKRPALAMVDSDRGITNLHVPSDVIIDASMPAMIRAGGKMWGPDGELADTKAIIPDRSYAGVYKETIEFCKAHGAFDVRTMGSVSNVGLMAKKAEEYGSHDKTFRIPTAGTVRVVDEAGEVRLEHAVTAGDIWRGCQTKSVAIRDWVRLAVERARATGAKAIFWLDPKRSHDAVLIGMVRDCLAEYDISGLEIDVLDPVYQCQDAVDCPAAVWRRFVRDRRRGVGAQTHSAVSAGRTFALGLAGRVSGPGGQSGASGVPHRKCPGGGAGCDADAGDQSFIAGEQIAPAQGGRMRQPGQSCVSDAFLGRGPGLAGAGYIFGGNVPADCRPVDGSAGYDPAGD